MRRCWPTWSAPTGTITARASGTGRAVLARHARNQRLADAIYLWAFASISASPGARRYYDTRRAAGDTPPLDTINPWDV